MTTLNGLDVLFAEETLQAAQRGVSTGQAIWWVLIQGFVGLGMSGDIEIYVVCYVLLQMLQHFFLLVSFFGPDDVSKAANSGSNHCIMGADGADGFWIKT